MKAKSHKTTLSDKKKPRVGIYSGAFDPVHAGHISFALQALKAARLDSIVFLPERRPRTKPGVEHYAHRIAMIKAELAPHPNLAVMVMVDKHFSVQRTLPQLQAIFQDASLVFLLGSDVALELPSWPHADRLLETSELVIGMRTEHEHAMVIEALQGWSMPAESITVVDSFAPDISSTKIRRALRANRYTSGLLSSVHQYSRREWLYVSPSSLIA